MSKFFAFVLLIVFSMNNIALGECETINISRQVGGITINFDAEVYGSDSSTAAKYIATPQASAINDIIRLIWPSGDISTILATKTTREYGEGSELFNYEIYEYEGSKLFWYPNLGVVNFESDTARKNSANDNNVEKQFDKDVFEQNEAAKTFIDQLVEMFSSAQYTLLPIEAKSITEKNGYTREHYEFGFELDGMVCNNQETFFAISGDREIPAQHLILEWDSEGLAYLSMRSYHSERSEQNLTIISLEDAIETLCSYLGMFIASDTIDILTIVLCYQMIPIAGDMITYEYVPVWKFQTSSNALNPRTTVDGRAYMVNAITGEMLE